MSEVNAQEVIMNLQALNQQLNAVIESQQVHIQMLKQQLTHLQKAAAERINELENAPEQEVSGH